MDDVIVDEAPLPTEPPIVTIACGPGLSHPLVIDPTPIWQDAAGNLYRVASGPADGLVATDGPALPDRVNIIVGVPGLAALALLGLTPQMEAE